VYLFETKVYSFADRRVGGWRKTFARHRNCSRKSLMVKYYCQLFMYIAFYAMRQNDYVVIKYLSIRLSKGAGEGGGRH
jgi:hypothetical protein